MVSEGIEVEVERQVKVLIKNFLSISQQAVSADITKNSAVGNIMQYLNHKY
jgi:hypothetical protein